jgi:hypothetical protein
MFSCFFVLSISHIFFLVPNANFCVVLSVLLLHIRFEKETNEDKKKTLFSLWVRFFCNEIKRSIETQLKNYCNLNIARRHVGQTLRHPLTQLRMLTVCSGRGQIDPRIFCIGGRLGNLNNFWNCGDGELKKNPI